MRIMYAKLYFNITSPKWQKVNIKHLLLKKLFVSKPYTKKCHCDLDLWPKKPKIPEGSSTSPDQPPYQVISSLGMSSVIIDQTRFVYQPTDGSTNMCKAIYPHFLEGGHKNNYNKTIPVSMYRSYCITWHIKWDILSVLFHDMFLRKHLVYRRGPRP